MGIADWRDGRNDEEKRKFDRFAHAATSMDHVHRLNHDGMVFHSSGKVTGMIDENVDDFLLVVPTFTYPHLQTFNLTFGAGDIDILVYEGATASADGTPVTPFATNRNSSQDAALVINQSPTVTDEGTLVHTGWLPPTATGVGQSPDGIVGPGPGEEWILAPETKYLVRLTNNSGGTVDYRFEALWYELDYES